MPRTPRRSIPPLLGDPRVRQLTAEQERTLLLLPLAVDDHGRALDAVGTINGLIWGDRWEEHPPERLDAELDALAAANFLLRYQVEGVGYLQVLDWREQQVISRPAASSYPAPPSGTRSRRGTDAVWGTVENLVGVVSGAAEKLQDPALQAQGVRLLSDLAGQLDPKLARRVRERAGTWVGTAATAPWSTSAQPPSGEPASEDALVQPATPVAQPPAPADPDPDAWANETDPS